ncbi:NADPH-dependent F420 reductase [Agrobacterium vitis]|uniref:NAD(P)-binding domain-containing protein n=1 Tax=Agrobacterium vitis TaxID=373 RepID=A0AAE2R9G0_AGRVI|nr:NAD(P)-binding domain-containing protein [Agrobacterium vitis]MBF2714133.1 NAD(P)-binding domain-containing protein [Agrobacterium vitis]NSY15517.1 NAD(P)-binding domain-containing protein [Agrobacterium vitis]NSY25274.1 NAD(P)-binding domain-containing protein [Agrobacterium vitis]NTA24301.1 NAD(P)-binding domain-containing protein [Agrobacterium vitis]WEO74960.1 NAD(P)-binding domain-containing protein [Agrobacterium vitis]
MVQIALIGAGRMGQAIARLASAAGHEVILSNSRGPDTLLDLAQDLGPKVSAANVSDAIKAADLVILATPWGKTKDAVSTIKDWNGKIVVDTTNNRAGPQIFDIGGIPSSMVVAGYLPGARVVKAFNHNAIHVFAEALESKSEANALYVSGDDAQAKKVVAEFISSIGGEPIDAGDLGTGARLYGTGGVLPGNPLEMLRPAEARAKLTEAMGK